ncbi:Tetraacyldisaccharide 4'-kinase [uncultured delta proteobacterium]|uniref:Tetraacyldisaccharide 4'-kinase n=1 Tax=uncultured delta proteobacterium TaxID=34034 RepID=A0A212IZN6_9DELT|nr:Tetraacyldisaccharide 4'-kinase [uncultured delta proteobacterium]
MSITALQRRFSSVLRPAASAYGMAMRLRALRYGSRLLPRPYRAACPVVSVGNISWGGTGKTPVVDYLLGKTAESGLRTVVLTRGYKAAPPELPFPVHRDDDPASVGDEPLLLARRHPNVLVLVDPKRSRAAAWAEKNAKPQLFLLDDGMQHLAVERDLNLVLLTPGDLLDGWNKVIPAGKWREDKSALSRADAFCMKVDAAILPGIIPVAEKRLAAYDRPLFFFDLLPTGLTRLIPYGRGLPETAPDLGGSPYTLVCGTGNPDHVRKTASSLLGREPADSIIVQDHHHYAEADVTSARQKGYPVVCTAKDAVKLAPFLPIFNDTPVWILDVRAVFSHCLFTRLSFDAWWAENLQRLLSLRFT